MKCQSCGKRAKLTWCEKFKTHVCKDCCLKESGRTCDWEKVCVFM
jgi:hypothetical protein